jgi:hypothetical protein
MRQRAFILLVSIAAVVIIANGLTFTTQESRYSESYPAVVCPPITQGQISYLSLTSPKTPYRITGVSSMNYKSAKTRRISGGSQAVVIDSTKVTPIAWVAQQGVWAGAVSCVAPIATQWFVGASADVTSKGALTLVNSGLGKALVTISAYTERGAQADQLIQIRANSITNIPLATLVPGANVIAIKVTPQTGRVNAFLSDIRGRGLRALGGDIVNGQADAAKELVIPAIPQQTGKKSSMPHTLRLLVPGEVGAHINATIISTDGVFAPAGIDGASIPAGRVVELPINAMMQSGKFALRITSDRPLVASVFSKTLSLGKSDFVWSTPTPPLQKLTMAVTGLSPMLIFTGTDVKVDLDLTTTRGKVGHVVVKGSDIATYSVPDGIRAVTITKVSQKTYGAALIATKSGFGFAPLISGSELTRSSIPHANIRVLIP